MCRCGLFLLVLPSSLLPFSLDFFWHLCNSLHVCHCLFHLLWFFSLFLFVLCLGPTSKNRGATKKLVIGFWLCLISVCAMSFDLNCAMTFDSLLSVSTPEVHFMNSSKMTSCIHDRHTRLPLRCRDSLCLLRCLSEALHHLLVSPLPLFSMNGRRTYCTSPVQSQSHHSRFRGHSTKGLATCV